MQVWRWEMVGCRATISVVALPATLYETLGSPRGLCWKLGLCAFCCSAFTREEMAGSL